MEYEDTEYDRKIMILGTILMLLEIEHPEFQEEGTTGNDLMLSLRDWQNELENKRDEDH